MENKYFGGITFFYNFIFQNSLCILKEQESYFLLLLYIFIMANTKWKLNIIVDRLTDLWKNCCQGQVNSCWGLQRQWMELIFLFLSVIFLFLYNPCCPFLYYLDKSLNTWRKNDNFLKRLLLYKIFCVIKPHPMGLTQRSLYLLLDSGMLSVLDLVPVGQSYDANGDSEMKP